MNAYYSANADGGDRANSGRNRSVTCRWLDKPCRTAGIAAEAVAHRNARCSVGCRRAPSNLGLLRYFQSVIDLDAEIANGALQLGVTK